MPLALIVCAALGLAMADDWKPVPGRIMTRWAAQVRPEAPLPEHPRPQLVREKWRSLNGLWDYAIRPPATPPNDAYDGKILVPYPVESALSGVGRAVGPGDLLVYRRTFDLPKGWEDDRTLLHFGAVDWEARVLLNGREVGRHTGGYDPFTFDLTPFLTSGPQTIEVRVTDPTDTGYQPRGKQTLRPQGIFYTAVTGIWQTVWLESVPKEAHLTALKPVADLDAKVLRLRPIAEGLRPGDVLEATLLEGKAVVAEAKGAPFSELVLAVKEPKLWSPDHPFLYDLNVRVLRGGKTLDEVKSYAAMRSVGLAKDDQGVPRLTLNGNPIFHLGPLDQGWWPDGLYTAPTDEALRFDVEVTRRMGFNMARKHVKVEPARWYYHCDRLGLMVWQDMPSGWEAHVPTGGADSLRYHHSDAFRANYAAELRAMVDALFPFPSIVMWVPYNEGWGQAETKPIAAWLKAYDPSRTVDSCSGWDDHGVGDVHDVHVYPGPGMPPVSASRAAVLGEFGGLGFPVRGHLWKDDGNWGYQTFATAADLEARYREILERLLLLKGKGLSAGIYTQTTDVEVETNGLLTYDRAVEKMPAATLKAINERLYGPAPTLTYVVPTSEAEPQTWRYTINEPPAGWETLDFRDAAWKSGPGVIGSEGTPGANVRTPWTTDRVWLRREFTLAAKPAADLRLYVHHDEDADVYLNGVRIASLKGYTTDYIAVPLPPDALAAFRTRRNVLAAHVRNTRGGQCFDAGFVRIVAK
ncbi:MAG: hypothetical protein KIS66_01455 [Fimbriimonadaceae bacterium]|nr:hypothetical protein [Fimbriimonadaceae bacterium]